MIENMNQTEDQRVENPAGDLDEIRLTVKEGFFRYFGEASCG
jgi:hypothetical protein